MVEIIEKIKEKRGGMIIWFLVIMLIFASISSFLLEVGNLYLKSKQVKAALNRAVKAGALEEKQGENLAKGEFIVDEVRGKESFKKILAHNLGLNEITLEPLSKSLCLEAPEILELEVLNTTPHIYTSPTLNRNFSFEKPTIVAVVKLDIQGFLIKRTFLLNKFSSAHIKSIYDK